MRQGIAPDDTIGLPARDGQPVRVKVAAFKLVHPDRALLDIISFLR